jgi:hypothetical protein
MHRAAAPPVRYFRSGLPERERSEVPPPRRNGNPVRPEGEGEMIGPRPAGRRWTAAEEDKLREMLDVNRRGVPTPIGELSY